MKRLLTLSAVLLAFGLWWAVSDSPDSVAEAQKAAKQPRGKKRSPILLYRCRIKLIHRVTLSSDRPGVLAFVEPEEGDGVKAGQQVAGLRDEVARAVLASATKKASNDVQIRYAKKATDVAEVEYNKALQTNRKVPGTVPDIEIRRLYLAYEKGSLQIEQADHEFAIAALETKEAAAQLETYQVKAPFDGVVTRVYKRKGEAVRQGDPILEVVSTRRVRVEGYVDIHDVGNVKPGDPVIVQLDIPDVDLPVEKEFFQGQIAFVDPGVQSVTKQTRIWAEVTNRGNILRAGLTAKMTIHANKQVAQTKR